MVLNFPSPTPKGVSANQIPSHKFKLHKAHSVTLAHFSLGSPLWASRSPETEGSNVSMTSHWWSSRQEMPPLRGPPHESHPRTWDKVRIGNEAKSQRCLILFPSTSSDETAKEKKTQVLAGFRVAPPLACPGCFVVTACHGTVLSWNWSDHELRTRRLFLGGRAHSNSSQKPINS